MLVSVAATLLGVVVAAFAAYPIARIPFRVNGLVLVYATYNLPFNVFVLVGFLRTLPRELEEQAAVDGASPMWTFLRIILPLLGPGSPR